MSSPGYDVAATVPAYWHAHALFERQSSETSNLTGGVDKWSIGNNTAATDDQYRWIFIVDQTILVSLVTHTFLPWRRGCHGADQGGQQELIWQTLTVAGSFAILLTMFILEYRGRPATTRMRLVQSLVLSDLILGYVGSLASRQPAFLQCR